MKKRSNITPNNIQSEVAEELGAVFFVAEVKFCFGAEFWMPTVGAVMSTRCTFSTSSDFGLSWPFSISFFLGLRGGMS